MNDSAQDLEQLIHQYTQELLRFQKQYAAQMTSAEEDTPAVPVMEPVTDPVPLDAGILDDPILADETSFPAAAIWPIEEPAPAMEPAEPFAAMEPEGTAARVEQEEEASPLPIADEAAYDEVEMEAEGEPPLDRADDEGQPPQTDGKANGITRGQLEAPYMRQAALEGETNGIGTGENAAMDSGPMGTPVENPPVSDDGLDNTDQMETEPAPAFDGEERELMSDPDAGEMEAFPQAPGENTGGYEMTDFGRLQVQVFKAQEAIPIENATVTIFLEEEDGPTPITVTKTNRSGFTPAITVPTVSATLSLSPGNEHPYASYLVQVIVPGYFTVEDIRVPVYGGITSVQPVEMLPLPENYQGDSNVTYPEDGPNL